MNENIVLAIESSIGKIPYNIDNIIQVGPNLINVNLTTYQCGYLYRKMIQIQINPDTVIDLRTERPNLNSQNLQQGEDKTAHQTLENLNYYINSSKVSPDSGSFTFQLPSGVSTTFNKIGDLKIGDGNIIASLVDDNNQMSYVYERRFASKKGEIAFLVDLITITFKKEGYIKNNIIYKKT